MTTENNNDIAFCRHPILHCQFEIYTFTKKFKTWKKTKKSKNQGKQEQLNKMGNYGKDKNIIE